MEFEEKKKGKYKRAKRFVKKMKEIQEKTKAALEKAQEEMKRYTNCHKLHLVISPPILRRFPRS